MNNQSTNPETIRKRNKKRTKYLNNEMNVLRVIAKENDKKERKKVRKTERREFRELENQEKKKKRPKMMKSAIIDLGKRGSAKRMNGFAIKTKLKAQSLQPL